MAPTPSSNMKTEPTACILCSRNCGIEVETDGKSLLKIRGDRKHPSSSGYLCQKATRLNHYQNHTDRLQSPLRRKPDGSFEPISWETAIAEIAAKLLAIRNQHGGRAFAYYGGGGQGNHLGGIYGASLLRAMRSQYHYNALAQEKTGDFWVNGKLFGRQTCHITEGVEQADAVIFLGTNPWQAHGIPNARETLHKLSKDPDRLMIVIDPRKTETAKLADIHLAVRPGTDAFLMAAMLAILVRDQLVDTDFLEAHTSGSESLLETLQSIPIEHFVERAGLSLDRVTQAIHGFAKASTACVRVDLGIQQSLHSTLNSYLEKLLFLLTGNLGKAGSNNFHTFLLPLIGHSPEDEKRNWRTVKTGYAGISKIYPPNVLPGEINNDNPDRIRAVVIDSANPLLSGADSAAYRTAFEKLECAVVIDVAMTETARAADYVLPASSQFEKWEATFFNLEFPRNYFHLRKPILEPKQGTLPESEIYARLLTAMGELPADFPILKRIAKIDRKFPRLKLFPAALAVTIKARPKWMPYAAIILMRTLGQALPDGAAAAAPLWFACLRYAKRHTAAVQRAGYTGQGAALGEALFTAILNGRSGVQISEHLYEDTWKFLRHADKRIHLNIPEMIDALTSLKNDPEKKSELPFLLAAGERRDYNANTIFRDPSWRKADAHGSLRIHPDDARALDLEEGSQVLCRSTRAEIMVQATLDDSLQKGLVTLPHGHGMRYGPNNEQHGPAINELTDASSRDSIAGTPYHKYVPVDLIKLV